MAQPTYKIKDTIEYRPLLDKSGLVIFDTLRSTTHIISTFSADYSEALHGDGFTAEEFSQWLGTSSIHAQQEIQRLCYLDIIEEIA